VQKTKLNERYFVCIGDKTAQKLKELGFEPGYICKRNYSEFMSEELKNKEVLKNKKSLLVQGSLSDNKLIESLKSFSNTEKIISYSTELVNKKYSDLEKITKKYKTYVVFTSPSSFDSFIKFYDASKVNLVSIGNTTSSHITNLGFQTILTSKMQSYEGISESLIAFFNENKQYELSKN
jgi:uroporphyrinogen-III synthase